MNHQEDTRTKVFDSQVLTIAVVAAKFFYGNHQSALSYLESHKIFKDTLDKSRFNRRLHRLSTLVFDISFHLGKAFKELNTSAVYIIDSFPVAICHNIRISRCRILPKDEDYRGYNEKPLAAGLRLRVGFFARREKPQD